MYFISIIGIYLCSTKTFLANEKNKTPQSITDSAPLVPSGVEKSPGLQHVDTLASRAMLGGRGGSLPGLR